MRLRALSCFAVCVLIAGPSFAAGTAFSYKTSYRNVARDPDKVWTSSSLAPRPNGTVTIHEYQLRTPHGDWLVSQIWNDDCSSTTCPTRLVRIAPNGEHQVVVDDMMHQIVLPDDPQFAAIAANKAQAEFASHPFVLSDDEKTLINGDYRFPIGGAKR